MSGSSAGQDQGPAPYQVSEIPQVVIGGSAPAGGYSVSPEYAPMLIKGLREAQKKLQEIDRQRQHLQYVKDPDTDPYSIMVAAAMRRMLGDEPGGYGYANRRAQEQLVRLIERLEASLKVYRDNEDRIRRNFMRGK
ncbi:hypothetical protein NLX83_26190 [Allokutzneria sp. A3M-2-11 16]|uniref:hypothetical protein n=1 Tax=Allokutzneria sp. A3M-2-11 16 TaxID=2962043 RepID=UPI0020B64E74|nr:hypothetical protein [Allokutzneria sp. A3M-2-11 16]MCP3802769.1 hypothetical protein [Allokutzneria sp. A3M-2-11 16]